MGGMIQEIQRLSLQAFNLLGVAIEAEHAEAIERTHKAIGALAQLGRDVKQGSAVAGRAQTEAIFKEMLKIAELIPAWEARGEGGTYKVAGRAYCTFASEREAAQFCAKVLEKIGTKLEPATTEEWPKYWLD